MKISNTLQTLLFLAASASSASAAQIPETEFNNHVLLMTQQQQEETHLMNRVESLRETFVEWKNAFQRDYTSVEEEFKRMLVWVKHHDIIEKHNNQSPSPSYKLGHNNFSDMSNDEFQKQNNLGKYSPGIEAIQAKQERLKAMKTHPDHKVHIKDFEIEFRHLREQAANGGDEDDDLGSLPRTINWIEGGAVTPVKNQERCGSCWAFSATGAIEGAMYIKSGQLTPLSEQNLLDCDHNDNGCEGGIMENAFQFDESFHGLCSEENYPYLAIDGHACDYDCAKVDGSQVQSYIDIPEGDKHGLIASIVMQPTSVAMQADQLAFQLYSEGVFDDDSCGERGMIDHGVLAVGYGHDEDADLNYITIKNSWGEDWGEDGYIRLKRHSPNEWGTCAILRIMTTPVME